MSESERLDAIGEIAKNPRMGVHLDGGLRKVRFAVGGKGKSGGVRIVYYFYNESVPVFLLDVFGKNEKDNLTEAELKDLVGLAKSIPRTLGAKR